MFDRSAADLDFDLGFSVGRDGEKVEFTIILQLDLIFYWLRVAMNKCEGWVYARVAMFTPQLLSVIPSLTLFSNIVSGMPSGSMSGMYSDNLFDSLSGMYSDMLSVILPGI